MTNYHKRLTKLPFFDKTLSLSLSLYISQFTFYLLTLKQEFLIWNCKTIIIINIIYRPKNSSYYTKKLINIDFFTRKVLLWTSFGLIIMSSNHKISPIKIKDRHLPIFELSHINS